MQPSRRLVFFGTEDFSLPSLVALTDAGYDIAAVVTKPDTRRGRGKKLVQPAVKVFAAANNIPVLQPEKLSDIYEELKNLHATAGVLVSYGKILPARILDVFEPVGIINVHPSLLPKYRGPAPIEAAILHGDKMTGVSIMKLISEMDAGPVYQQVTYELSGKETKPELSKTLAELGASLLSANLDEILSKKLQASPQKNTDVSYTSLLTKENSVLDPTTDTAHALERKVRAYLGYPKAHLKLGNNDVIITSVKVVETLDAAPLVVACKDETYLSIDTLIAPSGKSMSGEAYKRGYAA